MKTVKNLIDIYHRQEALIICAGTSTKIYQKKIQKFIDENKPFIIGINNITDFFIPQYHLWTNTKRFRSFGNKIHKSSNVLLGAGIHLKTVREIIGLREYTVINFTDMKEGVSIGYKKGKILGFFRTAGNLAIMISHLMGAEKVNIVGMDGHTFYDYKDVREGKEKHHCYNEDYKPFSKEICFKKDEVVTGVLGKLKEYGIDLKILTPTVYKDFYGGF